MHAGLTLQFAHHQRQVPIRIFIPRPEQRPRTVANFVYMCTGELPPTEMLAALNLPVSALAYRTSEAARTTGGLKPFTETSVVRVEKGVMVEVGASTSKTIFGGFIPDERLRDADPHGQPKAGAPAEAPAMQTIAATLPLLKPGTVLCGNVGMPDSHASRYYILLANVSEHDRLAYAGYAPLGMVTSGLEALIAAANQVPVHVRSLEPLKRVTLAHCTVEFDYQHLLAPSGATPAGGEADRRGDRLAPLPRISGRTRRRDEDEEEEAESEEAGGSGPRGFFHYEAKYQTGARAGVAGPGSAAKRRRAELVTLDENNQPVLRTTAVMDVSPDGSEDEDEEGDGSGRRRRFNYFSAQEAAFLNDIDDIKVRQKARTHNKMRKLAKGASAKGFGTKSAKKIREKALQAASGKGWAHRRTAASASAGTRSGASGGSSGSSTGKPKRLNRKY